MASIGHVTANKNGGFKGQLKTLSRPVDAQAGRGQAVDHHHRAAAGGGDDADARRRNIA